jgi:hypothetical protein
MLAESPELLQIPPIKISNHLFRKAHRHDYWWQRERELLIRTVSPYYSIK